MTPDIVFGRGSLARLGAVAAGLGMTHPVLVTTPRRRFATEAAVALGMPAPVIDTAQDHCPALLVEQASAALPDAADGVIALGGGSAIGLAKALADVTGLPLIAVPTSFAGSALTDSYGVTSAGVKRVTRSARARARAAIYDPTLFDAFHGPSASASAFNGIAHAVDALFGDPAPGLHTRAMRAVTALIRSLPRDAATPADGAVEGAMLAARCLSEAGPGLHHRLCHPVGGRFGTPHGFTHAILLPHSIALRRGLLAHGAICKALGYAEPAGTLYRLARRCGVPRGLAELGVPEDAIAPLALAAGAAGIAEADALSLFRRAWRGDPPPDPETAT